jgi:hypothetical protein
MVASEGGVTPALFAKQNSNGAFEGLVVRSSAAGGEVLAISYDGSVFNHTASFVGSGGYVPLAWTVSGSEQMRLTSTGLGIGTSSPAARLGVYAGAMTNQIVVGLNTTDTLYGSISFNGDNSSGRLGLTGGGGSDKNLYVDVPSGGAHHFRNAASVKMLLDSSGNLGLGVTPNTWSYRSLSVGTAGTSIWQTGSDFGLSSNAYNNGGWKYNTTGGASLYDLAGNQHIWYNAPSGTAGNAITFTQAMSLTASGDWLLGKTNAGLANNGIWITSAGQSYNTIPDGENTLHVYSSAASAYRFYVSSGGTINATNTTITAISDQRLKENIRDLDDGLATVMALKPRKFDWKDGKGANIKNARGFIAQEFETVLPDMIEEWLDPAPEGEAPYKAVNANLIPTLVKAIQELKLEFDAYKAAHP